MTDTARLWARQAMMCGLRRLPFVGAAVEISESVNIRRRGLANESRLDSLEAEMGRFQRTVRDLVRDTVREAMEAFSRPQIDGVALTKIIREIKEMNEHDYHAALFDGLFQSSTHYEALKSQPENYGILLEDHSQFPPGMIPIFLDFDKTRLLALPPASVSLILSSTHGARSHIEATLDVWALPGAGEGVADPAPEPQPIAQPKPKPKPKPLTPAEDAQRRFACTTTDGEPGIEFGGERWPLDTTKIEYDDIPHDVRREITDAAPLAALTALRWLDLRHTQVSDLTPLSGLTGLETLELFTTQVSNLTPLRGLTGLQKLGLDRTQVSDISHLAALTGLQMLSLWDTQVSDFTPLQGLAGLQTLYLTRTQVRDLTPLQGMTALQGLSLGGTQVRDLTPLRGLTGLRWLDLGHTQVRDLTPLQGLTALHYLGTPDTPDTREHGGFIDTPENRAAAARAIREWRPRR